MQSKPNMYYKVNHKKNKQHRINTLVFLKFVLLFKPCILILYFIIVYLYCCHLAHSINVCNVFYIDRIFINLSMLLIQLSGSTIEQMLLKLK